MTRNVLVDAFRFASTSRAAVLPVSRSRTRVLEPAPKVDFARSIFQISAASAGNDRAALTRTAIAMPADRVVKRRVNLNITMFSCWGLQVHGMEAVRLR